MEDGEDLHERAASSSSSSSSGTSLTMTSVSCSVLASMVGTGRTMTELGPVGAATLGMAAGAEASKVVGGVEVAAGGLWMGRKSTRWARQGALWWQPHPHGSIDPEAGSLDQGLKGTGE